MFDRAVLRQDLPTQPSEGCEEEEGHAGEQEHRLYSVRVNDKYRVTLRWEQGHAHEVRVEDYH